MTNVVYLMHHRFERGEEFGVFAKRGAAEAAADLRREEGDPAALIEVIGCAVITACCDMHNRNCEPPSELCCDDCTEARHAGWTAGNGVQRFGHPAGEACSAPDTSGNTPIECCPWAGEAVRVGGEAAVRYADWLDEPRPSPAEAWALGREAVQAALPVIRAAAVAAERERIAHLEAVLADVLRRFTEHGHPGVPSFRSQWVHQADVAGWRQVLASTRPEGDTS